MVGKASNAEAALALIKQHQPEIIFIDISLQRHGDGFELAEKINELHQIPFVFVTGNSDGITINLAKKLAPLHLIFKPINISDFDQHWEIILNKLESQNH